MAKGTSRTWEKVAGKWLPMLLLLISANRRRDINVMDKEIKCPWCGEIMMPKASQSKNEYGHIAERKCSCCSKVLAAYLKEEGDFFSDIRTF